MMGKSLPSGMWAGYYLHNDREYPQQMRLEFADGLMRGDGDDEIGEFTIEGEFRVDKDSVRLGWVKTYTGAHSVLYLGTLENGMIIGQWEICGYGEGFALTPVAGQDGMRS